jgi:hypothetical protein
MPFQPLGDRRLLFVGPVIRSRSGYHLGKLFSIGALGRRPLHPTWTESSISVPSRRASRQMIGILADLDSSLVTECGPRLRQSYAVPPPFRRWAYL